MKDVMAKLLFIIFSNSKVLTSHKAIKLFHSKTINMFFQCQVFVQNHSFSNLPSTTWVEYNSIGVFHKMILVPSKTCYLINTHFYNLLGF